MPPKTAMQVKLDTTGLDSLIKHKSNLGALIADKIMADLLLDLNTHFSKTAPAPSLPGQPPAIQTGYLRASMRVVRRKAQLRTLIIDAPYWYWLEFGTMKMAARPFVRPAVRRAQARMPGKVKASFRQHAGNYAG